MFQLFPLKDKTPAQLRPYIFDFWWDMKNLHGLPLPTETMPIVRLLWHLDLPWWKYGGEVFSITPSQVKAEPEVYREQYERVMNTDLQYPLIVRKDGDCIIIMDGIHRLLKAVILGQKDVIIKIFDDKYVKDIAIQSIHSGGSYDA